MTPKGIQKEGKKDKSFASCNCNFNCCSNFDEDQRRNLREAFWGLADKAKQQEYVNRYVLKTDVKRKRSKTPTRSRTSKKYTLPLTTDQVVPVCTAFFMSTLNLKE